MGVFIGVRDMSHAAEVDIGLKNTFQTVAKCLVLQSNVWSIIADCSRVTSGTFGQYPVDRGEHFVVPH